MMHFSVTEGSEDVDDDKSLELDDVIVHNVVENFLPSIDQLHSYIPF